MKKITIIFISLLFTSVAIGQNLIKPSFVIEVLSKSQNSSSCKIYLQVDNNIYFIEEEYIPSLKDAFLEEENMITSVRGFQSGRQVEYIAVGEQNGIAIKKRELDGMDSDMNFKTIKTFSYSKFENGNKLRAKFAFIAKPQRKKVELSVNDEYFVGTWKSGDNTFVQVRWSGNNLVMQIGKSMSNGTVNDRLYDSYANYSRNQLFSSNVSKSIKITPIEKDKFKIDWSEKNFNGMEFTRLK